MALAHVAVDLGLGHQRRHRVDDDDVHRARAHQRLADLQRLLAGVGLGDVQLVNVDAQSLGNFGGVVPAGAWHTVEVLEPSVIFEAKDGKYGEDGSETLPNQEN